MAEPVAGVAVGVETGAAAAVPSFQDEVLQIRRRFHLEEDAALLGLFAGIEIDRLGVVERSPYRRRWEVVDESQGREGGAYRQREVACHHQVEEASRVVVADYQDNGGIRSPCLLGVCVAAASLWRR